MTALSLATNDNRRDHGASITFVRSNLVLLDTGSIGIPFWRQQLHRFEAIEIRPHKVLAEPGLRILEPCPQEDATIWAVIGRYPWRDIENCDCFDSEAEARAFRDGLIAEFLLLSRNAGDDVEMAR
jgi:hypothetical protein